MQSGCDKTLRDMNRHYIVAEYLEKVKLIREFFPNAGVTTDCIVGFPTETEEDFEKTMETVKTVAFSEMHIFPFSPRNGTVALRFKNVAKNIPCRIQKLTSLASQMKSDFIKSNYGLVHEVLIEEKVGEYFIGHTKNYIKCYIKADSSLEENIIVNVKLQEEYLDGAKAVLC